MREHTEINVIKTMWSMPYGAPPSTVPPYTQRHTPITLSLDACIAGAPGTVRRRQRLTLPPTRGHGVS